MFLDQDDIELVMCVARHLWLRRNAMVHGRMVSLVNTVVTHATEALMVFKSARYSPATVVAVTQS